MNKNLQKVSPSKTLELTAKVAKLKSQGIDVVNFTVGEPDFPTPDNIKKAGISAIENNFTKYTAAVGIPELRSIIAEKLNEKISEKYYKDVNVAVSNGGKHALSNVIYALLNEGDEVIIPAPYWLSYPAIVNLVGGVPKYINTTAETNYKIKPEDLEKAINQKSKILLLNSPSNPTGSVYSKEELKSLVNVAKNYDIMIISDEIYDNLVYDDFEFVSMASFPEIREKLIIINGVSKTYAMTGWRMGYCVASESIINAVKKVQSHFTSSPCAISQKATYEALNGEQESLKKMKEIFQKRRDIAIKLIKDIPEVICPTPKGAFYLFPNVSNYYNKSYGNYHVTNSDTMSNYLLEEQHVCLVPGIEFGNDENIRISYATSEENIEKGIKLIKEGLLKLK